MASPRFAELLRFLGTEDIELIVIGLLAGVLQGAPVMTLDVDVLHRRTPENADKLARALRGIGARYRGALAVLPVLRAALEESRHRP